MPWRASEGPQAAAERGSFAPRRDRKDLLRRRVSSQWESCRTSYGNSPGKGRPPKRSGQGNIIAKERSSQAGILRSRRRRAGAESGTEDEPSRAIALDGKTPGRAGRMRLSGGRAGRPGASERSQTRSRNEATSRVGRRCSGPAGPPHQLGASAVEGWKLHRAATLVQEHVAQDMIERQARIERQNVRAPALELGLKRDGPSDFIEV